jgi:Polysaccharide lyase
VPHRRTLRLLAVAAAALVLPPALVLAARTTRDAGTSAEGKKVSWTGDFETGDFGNWSSVLREGPGRARIVRRPVQQGRYAAEFVLGPQTHASSSRIEAHQPDVEASGGRSGSEAWYTWAEYVPAATRFARHASFNHLVQWHPTVGCYGSSLTVDGVARRPRLLLRIRGGAIRETGDGCTTRYDRSFDLGVVPRDRWLTFRLHVRWSADPRVGFVQLTQNGEVAIPFTRLATAITDTDVYLRQGLYRFRCRCRTTVFADAMTVRAVEPGK